MRVLVATDAWFPQVNGVVRTLTALGIESEKLGVQVVYLTPDGFPTIPLPSCGHIRLALATPAEIARRIEAAAPDAIHIATEGPIGHLTRRYCRTRGLRFTTSFHTRFPDYISARLPIPRSWLWRWLRWFHGGAELVMAATPALRAELVERGFRKVMLWPRGVDARLFRPCADADLGLPRPVFLTVGRVAVEKNLEAFLALDLPGSKVVVGDGPALARLARCYPDAHFLGNREGEALARTYDGADVFVFPSRTDTLGLVLSEALASALPVAAFPVNGPRDVIGSAPVGVLDEDLRGASLRALILSREACCAFAVKLTWQASARAFLSNIAKVAGRKMTPVAPLDAAV